MSIRAQYNQFDFKFSSKTEKKERAKNDSQNKMKRQKSVLRLTNPNLDIIQSQKNFQSKLMKMEC